MILEWYADEIDEILLLLVFTNYTVEFVFDLLFFFFLLEFDFLLFFKLSKFFGIVLFDGFFFQLHSLFQLSLSLIFVRLCLLKA